MKVRVLIQGALLGALVVFGASLAGAADHSGGPGDDPEGMPCSYMTGMAPVAEVGWGACTAGDSMCMLCYDEITVVAPRGSMPGGLVPNLGTDLAISMPTWHGSEQALPIEGQTQLVFVSSSCSGTRSLFDAVDSRGQVQDSRDSRATQVALGIAPTP